MQDLPFNPLAYPQALADPQLISDNSAWITHIPFAMALIPMLRPRTFVELGTFKGDSYCAFCQSVLASGTETRCFAIDTWQGDEHAGPLQHEVLSALRARHDPLYGKFSALIQSEFDAAAPRFEDGSIDLLHIDGLHTYEAVKHDYETWRPKLSDRAVVLFHDTQVRREGFGVWKFWEEISAENKHFEFHHGYGLGVLGVGANLPESFVKFLECAGASADVLRRHFFVLGHRIEVFRVASLMINAHMLNHRLVEQWAAARGQRLAPLASPTAAPAIFAQQVAKAVELLTKNG